MTTKLTLILAIKTEAQEMKGFARLTFYKNPTAARDPMGCPPEEAGALDMMLPSGLAAAYIVGESYAVTITEPVSLSLTPQTNVATLSRIEPEEDARAID